MRLFLFILLFLITIISNAAEVTKLSWTAPTVDANGNPMPVADITMYSIYCRSQGNQYDVVPINTIPGGTLTVLLSSLGLQDGDKDCAVSATAYGLEGTKSLDVSFNVLAGVFTTGPAPSVAPGQPTVFLE